MADPVSFAVNIALQAAISLIIAALRPKQEIEGPRLDDTTVSSAAFGRTIPIGYGTDVIGGNIIWGEEIEEVSKEYDIGKGNPFSLGTRTEYKYYLTCAVGISQREAQTLIGIYADGKLIYDRDAIDGKPSGNLHPFLDGVPERDRVNDKGKERSPPIIKNLEFNFYEGSLTQEQDPIMAADVGPTVCPAYRGLCYIVFNRMPLKDVGNRVPQFRFVISWGDPTETELLFREMGDPDVPVITQTSTYPWVYDRDRDVVFSIRQEIQTIEQVQNPFQMASNTPGDPTSVRVQWFEAADGQTGDVLYTKKILNKIDSSNLFNPVYVNDIIYKYMVGSKGDYLALYTDPDRFVTTKHGNITFVNKSDFSRAGSTSGGEKLNRNADPPDTNIVSSWTVPLQNVVQLNAGYNAYQVDTLLGPKNFILGGCQLNADGPSGTHLHSVTVIQMGGGIKKTENMQEDGINNILGVSEWRYGLVSGPSRGPLYGDSEVGFSFGFMDCIEGQRIQDYTYCYVMMRTDPNGSDAVVLYKMEMNSTGGYRRIWAKVMPEFGNGMAGGPAAAPSLTYVPSLDYLIYRTTAEWRAYDVSSMNEPDETDGGPIEVWNIASAGAPGRAIDNQMRQPESTRLLGRQANTGTLDGAFLSIDATNGAIAKTFTATQFSLGDTLNANYVPSVYQQSQERGLIFVELSGETSLFGWEYLEPQLGRGAEPLSTVVSDIVTRGKLSASYIDVTDLATTFVKGYVIGRDTTYRAALEPLQTAYNFIGVERDGKLVFVHQTGATDILVPEDDFVRSSNKNIFEEERKDEVTTPRMVFLKYRSTDLRDETATQHSRQITDTYLTVGSKGDVTTELPLVLLDQEAKNITQRMLYESRLNLDNFKFKLPSQYLRLSPGDVIQFTAAGRTESMRANQVTVGFDYEMEVEGALVDGDVYLQNAPAAIPYGSPNFSSDNVDVQPAPEAFGLYMDVYPIRPDMVSAVSRDSGFYLGYMASIPPLYAARRRFVGAVLQVSYAGTFETRANTATAMSYGAVASSIPNIPDANYNGVDESTIRVQVYSGAADFVSVTQAQMIGERLNVAMLYCREAGIMEIIRFRDVAEVTEAGVDFVELTGLMRGQRGSNTEALGWSGVDVEASPTYCILLQAEDFVPVLEPLSRLGTTAIYRNVPIGVEAPAGLSPRTTAIQFRGLKPFSVANPKLRFDDPSGGEYEITWDRRTRNEGAWNNLQNFVPLEEDVESYEVDILLRSGAIALRTLTTSTPSVLYTADMIDEDWGTDGLPDPLVVKIYQISAQVGRGFSYEAELREEI